MGTRSYRGQDWNTPTRNIPPCFDLHVSTTRVLDATLDWLWVFIRDPTLFLGLLLSRFLGIGAHRGCSLGRAHPAQFIDSEWCLLAVCLSMKELRHGTAAMVFLGTCWDIRRHCGAGFHMDRA